MRNLASAIDEVGSEDPASVPDAQLEERFEEVQRAIDDLDAVRLRLLGDIDRRRPFERDGYLSTGAWLASRFAMSFSTASDAVRMARSLREMPVVDRAFGDGELSPSAVRARRRAGRAPRSLR